MNPVLKSKIRSQIIMLCCFSFFLYARTGLAENPPHPGPRSQTEADVLFQEAQRAHSSGELEEAIRDLERFHDRYPSDPRREEAEILLLKSDYEAHHFEAAAKIAKEILHSEISKEQTFQAKRLLALSYLQLHQYPEAKITVDELLKTGASPVDTLRIKLDIFLAEKKLPDAVRTYDSLKPRLGVDVALETQKARIEILKCEMISSPPLKPGQKNIEESQMKYFTSKNGCFKEASLAIHDSKEKAAAEEWCRSHLQFQAEIKKSKLEKFAKEKLMTELNAVYTHGNCHDSTPR